MENCFCEDAFEAAMELTSATLGGESEVEVDAEGAEKVMAYFQGIFQGMCGLMEKAGVCCADEDDLEDEEEEPAPRLGCYEISRSDAGYHFVLKAANGEIIAVSEVYKTRAACMKGIASVRKNAELSPVLDKD